MTKRFLFLILLFLCLSLFCSFDWPVDNVVLKKTFGEQHGGEFNTGIILSGGRQAVHPVDYGEILFFSDDDGFPIPSGLGNFVVVEHSGNIQSIYSNLENGIPAETTDFDAGPERILGFTGSSGDAPGIQLNLEIVDLEFDQMVNPLNLLPPLPDNTDPVVEGFWINDNGWKMLEEGANIPPGEVELFISVYDQSENLPYFRPMAPYRLNIFANGEEVFYQTFESIESREGVLNLVSKQDYRAFDELYNSKGFFRIGDYTFNPGETIFEVVVSDYRGNKTYHDVKLRVSTR